jgi:hypothetical protein
VVLHRPGADEELRTDLGVGETVFRQPRDVRLLEREHAARVVGALPHSRSPAATARPTCTSSATASDLPEVFCPNVPAPEAAPMAATQRPATQEALFAPSGERPLWRELPSAS